jgi:predicted dehydrogenase
MNGQIMKDQIRIGYIGTSGWSDIVPLPAFASHPNAKLTAICGRNRTRAEEIAAKYGIPQVFTDYRQMIEQAELDAAAVVTPDDMHYEMVMAALEKGLHIFCDKPVALNAEHARIMYERAEAAGVKHMVMYTWRWMPQHRYLKQLLDEGFVGRPYDCSVQYLGGYGRSGDYLWRFDGQRANGILGDAGSHTIQLARACLGNVISVSAHLGNYVTRPSEPANDSALLMLEFEQGAHALLHMSAVAHMAGRAQEFLVRLHGEAGTLESDISFADFSQPVRGARHDEAEFKTLDLPAEFLYGTESGNPLGPFVAQGIGPRLLIDAILHDRPVPAGFDLYEGYKVQQVIDAALRSHETGQRVMIQ